MRIASTPPAWAACLAAFQQELTPQQFATWIRPLACADDAGKLKLTAPNRFVLQWVKDRFGSRIETLVRQATGTLVSIDFALADGALPCGLARTGRLALQPPPFRLLSRRRFRRDRPFEIPRDKERSVFRNLVWQMPAIESLHSAVSP